jgi:hypothetical protein
MTLLLVLTTVSVPLICTLAFFLIAPLCVSHPVAEMLVKCDRLVRIPFPGFNGWYSLLTVNGALMLALAACEWMRYRSNFGEHKDYDEFIRQARYDQARAAAQAELLAMLLVAVLSLGLARLTHQLADEVSLMHENESLHLSIRRAARARAPAQ